MKNLLVATLVALFSVSAFATKARLNSLGNARHLLDTQSIWNNPTDVYTSGDWISVEAGNNTDSYNTGGATVPAQVKAEGGMVQTTSFGKIGVFYGHRSDSSNQLVGAGNALILTAAKAVPLEQNPLDILWAKELGGLKTAFGLHYTDSKSDSFAGIAGSPSVKQSTLGAYGGVRGDVWDAYLRVGLGGTSKN